MLLDIQGQFSARKFMEKLRHVYDQHRLFEVLGPNASEQQIKANKLNFVRAVLQNLYIFRCMDAAEFNLTVRSMNRFLRRNKSIGLVVIDGIHFIENQDIQSQFEKKQVKNIASSKHYNSTTVDTLAAGPDVPTGDDFFGLTNKSPVEEQKEAQAATNHNA